MNWNQCFPTQEFYFAYSPKKMPWRQKYKVLSLPTEKWDTAHPRNEEILSWFQQQLPTQNLCHFPLSTSILGAEKISTRAEEFSCCSSLALQPQRIPFLSFPSRAQMLLSLPWIPPRKASGAQWNLGGKKEGKRLFREWLWVFQSSFAGHQLME